MEIGIIGKYVNLVESYKSLHEALVHGGMAHGVKVSFNYIDAEAVERDGPEALLSHLHGILVPGGFGTRGVEGKIAAIRYAREQKIPYLGLCFGMQLAVIEYARHLAGLTTAQSEEFNISPCEPVIYLMRQWFDYRLNAVINRDQSSELGGTMRLGAYPCVLTPGSLAAKAYGTMEIMERHRHRYEFNNAYRERLAEAGLAITGTSPNGELVEIVEIPDHPWFLGCQFHPEFKSRPQTPHPLFRDYVGAAMPISCAQLDRQQFEGRESETHRLVQRSPSNDRKILGLRPLTPYALRKVRLQADLCHLPTSTLCMMHRSPVGYDRSQLGQGRPGHDRRALRHRGRGADPGHRPHPQAIRR